MQSGTDSNSDVNHRSCLNHFSIIHLFYKDLKNNIYSLGEIGRSVAANDSVLVMELFTRTSFTLRITVQTHQQISQYIPRIYLHWESAWDVEKNSTAISVIAVQGTIGRLNIFSNNVDFNNTVQMIYYWIFKRNMFDQVSTHIKQHLPRCSSQKEG